jgi:hypothetical protein
VLDTVTGGEYSSIRSQLDRLELALKVIDLRELPRGGGGADGRVQGEVMALIDLRAARALATMGAAPVVLRLPSTPGGCPPTHLVNAATGVCTFVGERAVAAERKRVADAATAAALVAANLRPDDAAAAAQLAAARAEARRVEIERQRQAGAAAVAAVAAVPLAERQQGGWSAPALVAANGPAPPLPAGRQLNTTSSVRRCCWSPTSPGGNTRAEGRMPLFDLRTGRRLGPGMGAGFVTAIKQAQADGKLPPTSGPAASGGGMTTGMVKAVVAEAVNRGALPAGTTPTGAPATGIRAVAPEIRARVEAGALGPRPTFAPPPPPPPAPPPERIQAPARVRPGEGSGAGLPARPASTPGPRRRPARPAGAGIRSSPAASRR